MSRTYKDRQWKLRFPDHAIDDYEYIDYTAVVTKAYDDMLGLVECAPYDIERTYLVKKPGVFTKKKRKSPNDKYQWIGETPGWWVRMLVNRPLRRAGHMWETKAKNTSISASGYSCVFLNGNEYSYYDLVDASYYALEQLDVETPRVARGETSIPYYW